MIRPAIILLAGEAPSLELLQNEVSNSALVYCADGAAEYARVSGIKPHRIVGDLDSITASTREHFQNLGIPIDHVPDQNSDDFEKTLRALRAQFDGPVRVLGLTGKRTDHTLTNLSVMLKAKSWFPEIVAVEEHLEHFFLSSSRLEYSGNLPTDSIVSLSAFGEAVGVETLNLLYPLSGETLALGTREGLSNRVIGSPITIRLRSGAMLVSIERPR